MARCTHPVTVNKFGGSILCTRCSKVVGTWKDPQPKFYANFEEDNDDE